MFLLYKLSFGANYMPLYKDLLIWISFMNKCAVTVDGGVLDGAVEAQKAKTVGKQL